MLYVSLFFITPFALTVMSLLGASRLWEMLEEREEGAAEGVFGRAVSWTNAIKFLSMGMVVIIVTYYSAYSIGETVDQLIGWFDEWSDDEDNEGTRENGSQYIDGTSLVWDLRYHAIHVIYSWFIFNFMIAASHWLASNILGFKELEDCDLEGIDESYYSPVRTLIGQQVDMASCKTTVKEIFRIGDLDGNGHISRCENAKFLYGMGNSQKYALNYNEEKSLALLYNQVCYKRFSE